MKRYIVYRVTYENDGMYSDETKEVMCVCSDRGLAEIKIREFQSYEKKLKMKVKKYVVESVDYFATIEKGETNNNGGLSW